MSLEVRGKLLRWGNSFGIRLSRSEVEALRLRPGHEVRLLVEGEGPWLDPLEAHRFDLGGDAAERHDELFGFPEEDDG